MLVDLRTYDNLGTPKYFHTLLVTIQKGGSDWTETDIEKLFYNKVIDGRTIFDGCLSLANKLNLLIYNQEGTITISQTINDFLNTEKQMCDKFVELLLLNVKNDDDFQYIFSSKNLSYDIIYRTIQISNSAFPLKFSNFKQLLLDFEIISTHPTKEIKKYIFNSRYKKIFDKSILPEIRKRKIGIDELKRDLEQKQIYGEEAELFVLDYEKKRLNNKFGIDWVAEYSVAEGFDVSSFETVDSELNDRFIEVKSYSNKPYFFWSRNEMNIARIKGDNYYLYLVNRDEMHLELYTPIIIQNPHKSVLNNSMWIKEIEKFKIELRST